MTEPVSPRRRVAIGLALLVVALAVMLLGLELATRVIFDRQGMHYGLEMWKYARTLKRRSPIAEMGHEHTPGGRARLMGVDVEINSLGLRNPEVTLPKPPGVFRVVLLGDSMTFGWGARAEDTYARVLETLLNEQLSAEAGRAFEIVNTGVGNYNTAQEVAYFRHRGVELEPDLVLLGFYLNDAEPTPVAKESWLARHSYIHVFATSGYDSVARRLGYRPLFEDYYRALYAPDHPGWLACRRALDDLADVCQSRDLPLWATIIPELHFPGGKYPFEIVDEAVAQWASERDVPLVELRSHFPVDDPASLWVSPGDAHPNAKAHRIMAERLLQEFAERRPWQSSPASTDDAAPANQATDVADGVSRSDSRGQ